MPQASKLEVQLTSGQFDSSLFAFANGGDFAADATQTIPVTESLAVQAGYTVTLASTPADVSKTKINNLTYVAKGASDTEPAVGYFWCVTTGNTTTVTFNDEDVGLGDYVDITYDVTKSNAMTMEVSNDQAAIAEVVMKWPVYNGGENVSGAAMNGNTILGHYLMQIYRARVTAMPGFDTSLIYGFPAQQCA